MKSPFIKALEERVLLADGGMGTLLHARGVPQQACVDAQAIENPDIVRRVHEDYIAAGADIIETNTFGANRYRLVKHRLEDKVRDINFRAARLARDAREISGQPVFVAGAVGPTGRMLKTLGDVKTADVRSAFREQVDALLEGGVDLIILETFPDILELTEAIGAVKEACDLPIVAQMTFQRDGRTIGGEPPDEIANVAASLGAEVAGINCSLGPQSALEIVEQMSANTAIRVSAMPNAGLPRFMDGRLVYPSTAEYFAEYTRKLVEAGANIVGGCCGTTPEHIARMREALAGEWNTRGRAKTQISVPASVAADEIDVHVQDVRSFLFLRFCKIDEAIPVFGIQQVAHFLRARCVDAFADDQERRVLRVWLLEIYRRRRRCELGITNFRRHPADEFNYAAKMFGRSAAAAADDICAEILREMLYLCRKTLGGFVVMLLAVLYLRQPRIGQNADRKRRVLTQEPEAVGHMLRPGSAVHTDNVDREGFESGQRGSDLGSVEHRPEYLDRHLGDDRYFDLFCLKKLKDRRQRRLCLQQVLTCFDDQHIRAAINQAVHLFAVSIL